jgi:hypothetical protein
MDPVQLVTFRTVAGNEMWFPLEVERLEAMAAHIVRKAVMTAEEQRHLCRLFYFAEHAGLLGPLMLDLQYNFGLAYRPQEEPIRYDPSPLEEQMTGMMQLLELARRTVAALGEDARLNPRPA